MKHQFILLWSISILCTLLALPYIFALQWDVIAITPVPLWQIGAMIALQTAIILGVAIFFGLKLAQKIGLKPFALLGADMSSSDKWKGLIKLSLPIGALVALLIKFSDIFFIRIIPELAVAMNEMPMWKALLVAPYGGVVEELLMRLFFVSLFAWVLGKVFRSTEVTRSNSIMWVAIVAATVLFGIGHLPATAAITSITPLVVLRAILLNGIGGLAFGWLYWKKGLEYAIVAHFTTDIVLHAVLPALMK